MTYRKLTAIVRRSRLEEVEESLVAHGVPGLSVSEVKGFGEYANFFSRDRKVTHVKLEIFTEEDRVEDFLHAIRESAHTGLSGDGIIVVEPVHRILHIRTAAGAGDEAERPEAGESVRRSRTPGKEGEET